MGAQRMRPSTEIITTNSTRLSLLGEWYRSSYQCRGPNKINFVPEPAG